MAGTVVLLLGRWTCSEEGFWKFVAKSGEMARCVSIGEDTKFGDMKAEILSVFGFGLSETEIDLSFSYGGNTTIFTQGKMPPLLIRGDVEFKEFMKAMEEYGVMNLYVTFAADSTCRKVLGTCGVGNEGDFAEEDGRKEYDENEILGTMDDATMLRLVEQIEGQLKGEKETKDKSAKPVDNCEKYLWTNEQNSSSVYASGQDAVFGGMMDNNSGAIVVHGNMENEKDDMSDTQVCRLLATLGTDDDELEYDFDEWTEKINNDYPDSWDPYDKCHEQSVEGLSRNFEKGECSRKRGREEESVNCSPLGFNLGIESSPQNNELVPFIQPVNEEEESDDSAFVEDEFIRVGRAVINDKDPLLWTDAEPVRDNAKIGPGDERNMDLKRANDAIYVGRVFANKEDMKKILSVYAMKRLFSYRITKSDSKRVIVNCVDKNCGWRIYATPHPNSENLEIRTMSLKHSCDVSSRSRYGEKATAKILAELLQAKFANGKKGPRACELPDIVLSELNVTISYMKAWNAKELAIAGARGNEEESYRFLSTYLHLLKTTNPRTLTNMHTVRDEKGKSLFKYLFFALGASVDAYKHLRKVIVIDGTAMKGKYQGCLVAASCQDGNMQIVPMAFGVVDGENTGGWVWFLKNLSEFVVDDEELVFVSDRHTAIYAGLRQVYPKAQHATCTVHLCRNVVHRYKCEGLAGVVSKAATAFTIGDFRYWWDEIVQRRPNCAKYLLKIGLPHWTLSHFPGKRYNVMSSNISESLNAAMVKAVDYPIVSMVEFIRAMMMRWFCCRREIAGKTKTRCTPEIESILIDHLSEATDCNVLSASEWVYQVNDGSGCVFTVDLEKKTCTCRVFDVLMVPCCHALAARGVRKIDIYTLVGDCYFVREWRKVYETVVMPVPRERDSDVPKDVAEVAMLPPKTKRGGGRPKKVRIPSQGEQRGGKLKKDRKCGRCFGKGHNRSSCKNEI